MTADDLISLAKNPNFISGIYNYCDRWCERCHMTSRCLLYASTPNDDAIKDGSPEDQQKAVWSQVESAFKLTIEIIHKLAVERGIDLNPTEEDESIMKQMEEDRQVADQSPLTRLAKEYIDLSKKWLDNSNDVFKAVDDELARAALINLPHMDPQKESAEIKNAIDVIYWYQLQITVKLVRAQTSAMDMDDLLDDEGNPYPKDSDVSAKIALIGIDQSIIAWDKLLDAVPTEEKPILDILSLLVRLRGLTEKNFPDARALVRPGLD